MAFDVTEPYDYLRKHGEVYTVRPVFNPPDTFALIPIHIHRRGKWTGELGTKKATTLGTGREALEMTMKPLVEKSGFASCKEWVEKLVELHGEEVTTRAWAIYWVRLTEGQTTLEIEAS